MWSPTPSVLGGTGTDQKCAKVRVLFTLNKHTQPRSFKDLGWGMLVRDEGVAGSNPATPTITYRNQISTGQRFGQSFPVTLKRTGRAGQMVGVMMPVTRR